MGCNSSKAAANQAAANPVGSSETHVVPVCSAKDGGKTVMVIAASPMGTNSATNNVGKAFIEAYCKQFPNDGVKVLDISAGTGVLPHFTAARAQSKFKLFGGDAAVVAGDTEWKATQQLIDDFKAADKYVFLTPMWNLFIPYTLKLYLDHLVQPALTFGMPNMEGLVTGKPAMIIRASGGVPVGSDMDTGFGYMKAILGFIGFTDVRLLAISGTGDQGGLPALLDKKCKEAADLAPKFEYDANAKIEGGAAAELTPSSPAAIEEGAKVLFVTASPMGENSATKIATTKFLNILKQNAKVDISTLDLANDDCLPDFTANRVQAKFATWGGGKDACPESVQAEWQVSTSFMEQLKAADVYVFAVPMWNLTIPYRLKQWLDHVVQPHQTFDPATNTGLLQGKRAFVVACSGNGLIGSQVDHLTPYMKQILGFIGITNTAITVVKNKDAADEAVSELSKLCCLSDDKTLGARSA
jgi:FMN-dependent NADH-azoreductase